MIQQLEPGLGETTFPILDIVPANHIPQVGWVFSFTVTSWSMFPTIHEGDVLTIGAPDRIRVGDVIVFALSGMLVCHRITHVESDGTIRTRGDAAQQEDAAIRRPDVIGMVTSVLRGSRRFAPAIAPVQASMYDHTRLKIALFKASVGERLASSASSILSHLKQFSPVRTIAKLFLTRHVRFYLGVRVPVQSVEAYRFVPLAETAHGDRTDRNDVVIQARLGRHHLGTFHPSSRQMRIRRAAAGLGLEERFHVVLKNLCAARPSLDPR